MKIHYNNALNPEISVVIACGTGGPMIPATTDPVLVTCKHCQRYAESFLRPDPYPNPAIIAAFNGYILPWGKPRK